MTCGLSLRVAKRVHGLVCKAHQYPVPSHPYVVQQPQLNASQYHWSKPLHDVVIILLVTLSLYFSDVLNTDGVTFVSIRWWGLDTGGWITYLKPQFIDRKVVNGLDGSKDLSDRDVPTFCSSIRLSLNLDASLVEYLSKLLTPRAVPQYLTFCLAAPWNNALRPMLLTHRYTFSASSISGMPAVTDRDSLRGWDAGTDKSLMRCFE